MLVIQSIEEAKLFLGWTNKQTNKLTTNKAKFSTMTTTTSKLHTVSDPTKVKDIIRDELLEVVQDGREVSMHAVYFEDEAYTSMVFSATFDAGFNPYTNFN